MENPRPDESDIPPVAPSTPPTSPGALRRYRQVDSDFAPSPDECTMAMLCHVLAIFTWFIGPLVIWLMKKDQSRFVDLHGREALNWSFSIFIYQIAFLILIMISTIVPFLPCLCLPLYLALVVVDIVFKVIHAVAASNGQVRRYPMSIPFFGSI